MKKLSIITVCFNEAKTIEKTIKSVVGQTFTDFEYIVIDGGSTDGTVDIINKYSDRIDTFISEKDKGIYDAMNKGAKVACGDYLFFLNSGDFLLNSFVLQKLFNQVSEEDFVFADLVVLLKNGKRLLKKSPAKIRKSYMLADSIPHQATLTKKSCLESLGYYDTSLVYASDYVISLRIIFDPGYSYKHIPVPFCVYNLDGISSDKTNRDAFFRERKEGMNKFLKVGKFLKLFESLIVPFEKFGRILPSLVLSYVFPKIYKINS